MISKAGLCPKKATEALIAKISDLHLNSGIAHSVFVELKASIASIDRDQTGPPINKLKAAKNEIQVQSGNEITTFDADDLIPEVEKIIQRF